jgi:hypothetical protein
METDQNLKNKPGFLPFKKAFVPSSIEADADPQH